jgi:hypothetical protein
MRYSTQMARTTARLLLTVVLVLLSKQTATRPVSFTAEFEAFYLSGSIRNRAEQRITRGTQRDGVAMRSRLPAQVYDSLVPIPSYTILVFQLPPPVFPFLS